MLVLFALCGYVLGLVAPLTPSEGVPSLAELLVFVGVPISLLWVASCFCQSLVARAFCYFQMAAIGGFSAFLFLLQTGPLHS
jgi:hypothetical protein